jgi:hypothetical protein
VVRESSNRRGVRVADPSIAEPRTLSVVLEPELVKPARVHVTGSSLFWRRLREFTGTWVKENPAIVGVVIAATGAGLVLAGPVLVAAGAALSAFGATLVSGTTTIGLLIMFMGIVGRMVPVAGAGLAVAGVGGLIGAVISLLGAVVSAAGAFLMGAGWFLLGASLLLILHRAGAAAWRHREEIKSIACRIVGSLQSQKALAPRRTGEEPFGAEFTTEDLIKAIERECANLVAEPRRERTNDSTASETMRNASPDR